MVLTGLKLAISSNIIRREPYWLSLLYYRLIYITRYTSDPTLSSSARQKEMHELTVIMVHFILQCTWWMSWGKHNSRFAVVVFSITPVRNIAHIASSNAVSYQNSLTVGKTNVTLSQTPKNETYFHWLHEWIMIMSLPAWYSPCNIRLQQRSWFHLPRTLKTTDIKKKSKN